MISDLGPNWPESFAKWNCAPWLAPGFVLWLAEGCCVSGEVNVIFSCLNFFSFWFLSFVCAFVSVLQQHSKRLFLLSSARFPSWLSNPILALFFFSPSVLYSPTSLVWSGLMNSPLDFARLGNSCSNQEGPSLAWIVNPNHNRSAGPRTYIHTEYVHT